MSRNKAWGASGGGGGGVPSFLGGNADVFANLPTPIADYVGKLYFVETGSGTEVDGVFQYPVGLYTPNVGNTAWILTPINVEVSSNSYVAVNVTDWASFQAFGITITAGDVIWFNGVEFVNITGVYTVTDPLQDPLNWDVADKNLFLYYNDTGVDIQPFQVLHLKSAALYNGRLMPTPELADASSWEKTQGTLTVAKELIPIGKVGCTVKEGRLLGGDTSALPVSSQLWLSATTPGAITATKPEFPNYSISLGGNFNQVASPDGEILVSITTRFEDIYNESWDGAILESFDFRITSDGVNIIGTLTNQAFPTRNLTLLFSDGFYTLDVTTVPKTVSITAGTATVPQLNYVFIDKATKTLQISTVAFPTAEHTKIAVIGVFDAITTQNDGAIRNQNINDHIKKEDDNGHILHISERLRALNAEWASGVASTLAGTPTNMYVSTTAGKIWQLHKQDIPTQDMATGDEIHVVNDFTTPYRNTTNLNDITDFSTGVTWNNSWSNIVVWGIANKSGEASHLMVNLPSDGYQSEEAAIEDRNNYSNYTIPAEFKGVGFLIGRFTVRPSGGSFTYNVSTGYLDLRGFVPNNTAGGGAGSSGVTEWLQLSDTPLSYVGNANKVPSVNAGETVLEFKTVYLEYTDNADAKANSLTDGMFYRTGDILKVVHS
jgi:hypothetical protein